MSARTGLQIVTGCGWYTEPYYPPADDLTRRSTAEIAEQLVAEITGGFGETGVRPGIIGEIGASQGWISPLEERVHRAAARASARTSGLPFATHTLYHATGRAQMALLDEEGVDPRRVCIGHCDTFPSLDYCLAVARWGAYVSIDNIGHQLGDHEDQVVRLVVGLLDAGHTTQILLSQDVGQVPELRSRGGRGYTYLAETFLPACETRVSRRTRSAPSRWRTRAPADGNATRPIDECPIPKETAGHMLSTAISAADIDLSDPAFWALPRDHRYAAFDVLRRDAPVSRQSPRSHGRRPTIRRCRGTGPSRGTPTCERSVATRSAPPPTTACHRTTTATARTAC